MEDVKRLLSEGMSITEVCRATGYNREHVRKVQKEIKKLEVKNGPAVFFIILLIAAILVAVLIMLKKIAL